jgi:hypothetical protein
LTELERRETIRGGKEGSGEQEGRMRRAVGEFTSAEEDPGPDGKSRIAFCRGTSLSAENSEKQE